MADAISGVIRFGVVKVQVVVACEAAWRPTNAELVSVVEDPLDRRVQITATYVHCRVLSRT